MADNEFATILLGGNVNSKKVTVLTGNTLVKGDVVAQTAAGTADLVGTGVATYAIVLGKVYKKGEYKVTCNTATNGGTAGVCSVYDPSGSYLGVLTIGTKFENPQIDITITESTDLVAGDVVTITVAGSGKYVKVDSASVIGGVKPEGILLADADAASADVLSAMWITGEFDQAKLAVGTGEVAQYELELRGLGIILKSVSGGNY